VTVDAIQVRLEEHARRIAELERTQPAVTASHVADVQEDVRELKEEMKAQKRALYAVALSVASGAVIFAFSAFTVWGGP
jgi:hypothetical protein